MEAAQYLRKSRMEEGMDTEEVLAKHRKELSRYASQHDIHIVETYYEVVSGESLYARPEMLRLLADVEKGLYDAVLVMDIDRLSRGRMKDQGIILDALRDSGTLIITPEKTYDLSDDLDDELAEFKTFMSRREYKIINKRLRRGLRQSIQAGCYVANAPYGYRKVTVDRKPTLEINEEEARYVRLMFDLYLRGYGCISIARQVNAMGAHPHRVSAFSRSSVATILRNPTYMGKIVWDQKKHIKKGAHGNPKHITIYQPREKWTITDGLHPAIIDAETYNKAQEIMSGRYVPGKNDGTVKSSLAGLVKCAACGKNMQRLVMKGEPYLLCNTVGCCASAKFEYVETRVLEHLREALADMQADKPQHQPRDLALMEAALAATRRDLATANRQKARLYELLEIGEYDLPTYRERMDVVKSKIALLERQERVQAQDIERARCVDPSSLSKRIEDALAAYDTADAAKRNALLKGVIDQVWYTKRKKTKPMDFALEVNLKPF